MNTFTARYRQRVAQTNSLLCVGLDARTEKIPKRFMSKKYPQFEFNKWIIQETNKYVSAYKPNTAFYEARGAVGWHELALTIEYLNSKHPDILTIADAKRGDIGSTNEAYAQAIFDELGFDAVTLHPYLGKEAMQPFLDRDDKGCIFLCRTSNSGAGELQDLVLRSGLNSNSPDSNNSQSGWKNDPLWKVVAQQVANEWNENNNCMLVVGATYPHELAQVRQLVGEMILLVPGVGAQGGDLETVLEVGLTSHGGGLIINSSRGIIFSDDPASAARVIAMTTQKYIK